MSKKNPYLRVGTTYYKTIEKPLISGDKISILVRWNRETIISDHGKIYFSKVSKYDGFCGGSFYQQNKTGRYFIIERNFIPQKI